MKWKKLLLNRAKEHTFVAEKHTGRKTRIGLTELPKFLEITKQRHLSAKLGPVSGSEGKISFCSVLIGKKRRRLMVVKSFNKPIKYKWNEKVFDEKRLFYTVTKTGKPIYFNTAEEQFKILNELRQIPELKEFIPPTVRLLSENGEKKLLLTDLTENGKYLVDNPWMAKNHEIVQQTAETKNIVRIWICDAGLLKYKKDFM